MRSAMPRNSRASGRIWLAVSQVPRPWLITDAGDCSDPPRVGDLFAGGGGLLVDLGLLVEPVGASQPDLGRLVPPLAGRGQADPALPVVGQGLGMQPPVLEGLGGPVQHGAGLLEGGHTVLGHDLIGDRTADRGPWRRLGRFTRLGVLVLKEQPAKRSRHQGGDKKGEPDSSLVVAADGPEFRAGQIIGGLRHHGTSQGAESCRRSTGTNPSVSNLTISYLERELPSSFMLGWLRKTITECV